DEQVENDVEKLANLVIALAKLPLVYLNRKLAVAAVSLVGGPKVAQLHPRQAPDNAVRRGSQRRGNGAFGALGLGTAYHVVALVDEADKLRNVGRVVLQVTVHGDDDLAAGALETGAQADGLAVVAG
nr:hypothetical protein [Tanacetum cinerariifolium]